MGVAGGMGVAQALITTLTACLSPPPFTLPRHCLWLALPPSFLFPPRSGIWYVFLPLMLWNLHAALPSPPRPPPTTYQRLSNWFAPVSGTPSKLLRMPIQFLQPGCAPLLILSSPWMGPASMSSLLLTPAPPPGWRVSNDLLASRAVAPSVALRRLHHVLQPRSS